MTKRASRAVTPPPYPHAGHMWRKRLFDGGDVRRIAEAVTKQDSKLRLAEGVDVEAVADRLHDAFDSAMSFGLMDERINDARRLKRPWFRRLERDTRSLIETLGLTPEQCMEMTALPVGWDLPAIRHLQEAADKMPGVLWPYGETARALEGLPKIERRMQAEEEHSKAQGRPWTHRAQKNAHGRLIADILLDCAPRTLGLMAILAHWAAEEQPKQRRGAQSDVLRQNLFGFLAGAHDSMFGRAPKSRTKAGTRGGVSVQWSRRRNPGSGGSIG
jgi:hypothetical protein